MLNEELKLIDPTVDHVVIVYKLGRYYRVKSSSFKDDAVVRLYETKFEARDYANGVCDTLVSLNYFVRLVDKTIDKED